MNKNELKEVLDKHKKWLMNEYGGERADLSDADLSDANLNCANLRGVNLNCANLNCADLSDADLSDVNLNCANLRGANLRGADLSDANLNCAKLRGANLRGADLNCANLNCANLRGANLNCANLRGANLRGANLSDADLSDADLSDANLNCANLRGAKNVPFIPYACPDMSSFVGFKKARGNLIVELEILSDAKRCSATGRKCRCDKAKVLSITNTDGTKADVEKVASSYDIYFVYKIGEIVEEPNFDENRWEECSAGIHFFINRQEAVEYEF